MANKYLYSDVVLTKDNYTPETKTYKWTVKTHNFWTIDFQMLKFDAPKETTTGAKIVGEILLNNGDKKGIFENEYNWQKKYGATLKAKPNPLYVNLKPLISSGPVKEYKVSFVETELEEGQSASNGIEYESTPDF